MKNNRLLGRLWLLPATLTLAWCLTSCQQDTNLQQQNETDDPILADYRIIQALGYDISDISDAGDSYVVEGDIALNKDKLSEYAEIQTRQEYYPGSTLLPAYQDNIRVRVADGLKSYFYTAVKGAIDAWNGVSNTNIHFVNVTEDSSQPADIVLRNAFLPDYRFALANIPSGGKPGTPIEVNITSNYFSLNEGQKKMQAVHLLGHAMGLAHTRSWTTPDSKLIADYGDGSTSTIPNSQYIDDESVMVLSNYSKSFNSMPDWDAVALKNLYPRIVPLSITALSVACTNAAPYYSGAELSLKATAAVSGPTDTKYNYQWSGTDMVVISGQGTHIPQVYFTQPGTKQVNVTLTCTSATATPSPVTKSASMTITVTDSPLKINSLKITYPSQTYYRGDRIVFTAEGSYGGPSDMTVTYEWSGDNLVIESGQGSASVVAYFTAGGSQEVRVTATLASSRTSPSSVAQSASRVINLLIPGLIDNGISFITGRKILDYLRNDEGDVWVFYRININAKADYPVASDVWVRCESFNMAMELEDFEFIIPKGSATYTFTYDGGVGSVKEIITKSDDKYNYLKK